MTLLEVVKFRPSSQFCQQDFCGLMLAEEAKFEEVIAASFLIKNDIIEGRKRRSPKQDYLLFGMENHV